VSGVLTALQQEQALSDYVVSGYSSVDALVRLSTLYSATDECIVALAAFADSHPNSDLSEALTFLGPINDVRNGCFLAAEACNAFYADARQRLVISLYRLAEFSQDSLGTLLTSYALLMNINENLAMERGTGVYMFQNKEIPPDIYFRYIRFVGIQKAYNFSFFLLSSVELQNFRSSKLSSPSVQTALDYRQYVLEFNYSAIHMIDAFDDWFHVYTEVIILEKEVQNHAFERLFERTTSEMQNSVDQMLLMMSLLVVTMDCFFIALFFFARIEQLAPLDLLYGLERTIYVREQCSCKLSFIQQISLLMLTTLAVLLVLLIPMTLDTVAVVSFLIPVRDNVLLLHNLSGVIHELQLERGYSGAFRVVESDDNLKVLESQYVKTDASIESFLNFCVNSPATIQTTDGFKKLMHVLKVDINPTRLGVLTRRSNSSDPTLASIMDFYYDTNALIVDCFFWVASFYYQDDSSKNIVRPYLGDSDLGLYAILSSSADFATTELLVGLDVYSSTENSSLSVNFTQCPYCATYAYSVEEQLLRAGDFFLATFDLPAFTDSVSSDPVASRANVYRADYLVDGILDVNVNVSLWFNSMSGSIELMKSLHSELRQLQLLRLEELKDLFLSFLRRANVATVCGIIPLFYSNYL